MMVIFAKEERVLEVLKARMLARGSARRKAMLDMLTIVFWVGV
jgi:hypothetical protein